jgi:AmmeMemoRadiSam system protein B
MHKTIFLPLGIILIFLMLSCDRKIPDANSDGSNISNPLETEEVPLYHTWLSLNEMEYGVPLPPPPLEILPHGFFPWAGIASHHLLAHEYLDAWFSRLAEMRKPNRFYILSPDHFGISTEPYALTTGSWESGFGPVESDKNKVKELTNLLEVDLDTRVFQYEHGASVLMPYIKKYFPDTKVVVIAYKSEGAVNIPISRRLADALENEFDEKGKQENFLLISTDFSHHADVEETGRRDHYSEQYLRNTGNTSWNMVVCDNRPAMYIIDRLGKNNLQSFILYHTNSWEISNQWEDDVTSYFFVYFGDRDKS